MLHSEMCWCVDTAVFGLWINHTCVKCIFQVHNSREPSCIQRNTIAFCYLQYQPIVDKLLMKKRTFQFSQKPLFYFCPAIHAYDLSWCSFPRLALYSSLPVSATWKTEILKSKKPSVLWNEDLTNMHDFQFL